MPRGDEVVLMGCPAASALARTRVTIRLQMSAPGGDDVPAAPGTASGMPLTEVGDYEAHGLVESGQALRRAPCECARAGREVSPGSRSAS